MYGTKFLDMWRDVDQHDVKKCWADELSAYSIPQVTQAVNRLNEKPFPPTLPEFLELCETAAAPTITAHLPYRPEVINTKGKDAEESRARCMALLTQRVNKAPSPKWAYFAKLRDQAPHVMAQINEVIKRDAGRTQPSMEELDDYCRLHGIVPKSAWWEA